MIHRRIFKIATVILSYQYQEQQPTRLLLWTGYEMAFVGIGESNEFWRAGTFVLMPDYIIEQLNNRADRQPIRI